MLTLPRAGAAARRSTTPPPARQRPPSAWGTEPAPCGPAGQWRAATKPTRSASRSREGSARPWSRAAAIAPGCSRSRRSFLGSPCLGLAALEYFEHRGLGRPSRAPPPHLAGVGLLAGALIGVTELRA